MFKVYSQERVPSLLLCLYDLLLSFPVPPSRPASFSVAPSLWVTVVSIILGNIYAHRSLSSSISIPPRLLLSCTKHTLSEQDRAINPS